MRKFKLSVERYREKLEKEFGFADPEMVQRYANAKAEYKAGLKDFDVYKNDPNCRTCRKDKK